MRPVSLLVATLLVIPALTACSQEGNTASDSSSSTPSAEPETFDVAGSIELPGGCGSTRNGYYPDITRGAQVTVLNSDLRPVGLGQLGGGKGAPGGFGPCTYPFAVPRVPAGDADIFSLRIGSREPYQFTRADAGSLSLSLGD